MGFATKDAHSHAVFRRDLVAPHRRRLWVRRFAWSVLSGRRCSIVGYERADVPSLRQLDRGFRYRLGRSRLFRMSPGEPSSVWRVVAGWVVAACVLVLLARALEDSTAACSAPSLEAQRSRRCCSPSTCRWRAAVTEL